MPLPSLRLKSNVKARVLAGHPWVFANEVETLLAPECEGEVVECRDRTGRLLGTGIYNGKSQIVWRRLSRDKVELNADFIRQRLKEAIDRRKGDFTRLVWSESDGLPGLVVDRYAETLVVQIQSLALEKRSSLIGDLLAELVHPEDIVFRNDAPIRRLEGLSHETHTRSGRRWEPRWMRIGGVEYWLDLELGQKTGFYLDQREQHTVVADFVRQRVEAGGKPRVLDAFCNQGSFAIHAARAGAAEVLGLDSADDAIASARRNAERNRVSPQFMLVNVFDWMNDLARGEEKPWDMIILDPPPFAKSKSALEGALRGYKEINLRAMRRLAPGGILVTYSCSHHMQDADLRGVLASAAADARKKVQVLAWAHQPVDHPVLVTMPESEYLRGYILSVE